jgi:muconolactone D-isomerase
MLFLVHSRVPFHLTCQPTTPTNCASRSSKQRISCSATDTLVHLWRVVGRQENYSVYEAADGDRLHAALTSLPLCPWMTLTVTPLAQHPNAYTA